MLENILLISLISSLMYADLKTSFLPAKESLTISDQKNALICIQIEENLKKGKNFYILFESKDENSTINKTIYYNYREESCQTNTTQNISYDELSEFKFHTNKPNLQNNDDGFHYEYKLNKTDDAKKYILMLVTNFNGTNNFTIKYNTYSVDAVLIYVVVVVASLLGLIIIAIIIVCKCYVSKKAKQMAEYAKDSEEPLGTETIETK